MLTERGRRRSGLVASFVLGAATLLGAEVLAAGAVLWPPTEATAGTPHAVAPIPAPAAVAEPAPAEAPPPPSTSDTPIPVVPHQQPAAQRPGTLRLPQGGTATMVRKEVGPDAVLPVPQSLNEATWWGAALDAPGGASVFAGHVNWGGRTGPFAELWDARLGDRVNVVDPAGKAVTYRISQVVTLHKDELPQRADALFSQSGPHRVVLVTCGGRWLGGSTGYAENRVVIADPG